MDNQHRRSAEQAFEEALAKLQQLPPPPEAEEEALKELPEDLSPVWEEAGEDLEAFFAQSQTAEGEE